MRPLAFALCLATACAESPPADPTSPADPGPPPTETDPPPPPTDTGPTSPAPPDTVPGTAGSGTLSLSATETFLIDGQPDTVTPLCAEERLVWLEPTLRPCDGCGFTARGNSSGTEACWNWFWSEERLALEGGGDWWVSWIPDPEGLLLEPHHEMFAYDYLRPASDPTALSDDDVTWGDDYEILLWGEDPVHWDPEPPSCAALGITQGASGQAGFIDGSTLACSGTTVDAWTVSLVAGQATEIHVDIPDRFASFDPLIRIVDGAGCSVAVMDDGADCSDLGAPLCPGLTVTSPDDRDVTVLVESYGCLVGSVGSYTLSVDGSAAAPVLADDEGLAYGSMQTWRYTHAAQVDLASVDQPPADPTIDPCGSDGRPADRIASLPPADPLSPLAEEGTLDVAGQVARIAPEGVALDQVSCTVSDLGTACLMSCDTATYANFFTTDKDGSCDVRYAAAAGAGLVFHAGKVTYVTDGYQILHQGYADEPIVAAQDLGDCVRFDQATAHGTSVGILDGGGQVLVSDWPLVE